MSTTSSATHIATIAAKGTRMKRRIRRPTETIEETNSENRRVIWHIAHPPIHNGKTPHKAKGAHVDTTGETYFAVGAHARGRRRQAAPRLWLRRHQRIRPVSA